MNVFADILQAFSPANEGFLFMWILATLAFLAIALVIERWIDINSRTNVNANTFIDEIKKLVRSNELDKAGTIISSGKGRALVDIIGAGVRAAKKSPELIMSAIEEESLHTIPLLEKRIDYIFVIGNVSTLLGLMGTIYGLILSFAAVAQPGVDPVAKSSMLASGISTAMNTTLLGLIISVPCVLSYSVMKERVESAISDISRRVADILTVLLPETPVKKNFSIADKRIREEVDTEPNIAPMMNLMVILIPLLLSSAEFVKMGAIELKLPEAGGGGSGNSSVKKDVKLNLGIVIRKNGFNILSYYDKDKKSDKKKDQDVDIPLKNGGYDYPALTKKLANIKRKVLLDIISSVTDKRPENGTLLQLYTYYKKNDLSGVPVFRDNEDLKIVAEENIKYDVIVKVMDAARGLSFPAGKVTMFSNVSLAGGITQ